MGEQHFEPLQAFSPQQRQLLPCQRTSVLLWVHSIPHHGSHSHSRPHLTCTHSRSNIRPHARANPQPQPHTHSHHEPHPYPNCNPGTHPYTIFYPNLSSSHNDS
mmetsp:Transcript_3686/g.10602  ORF Transcript_3686/g.10602 Transcript_3686/m.10602 type:complete len:104 (+) Transcript_3686:540-851(+)